MTQFGAVRRGVAGVRAGAGGAAAPAIAHTAVIAQVHVLLIFAERPACIEERSVHVDYARSMRLSFLAN